MTTLADIPYEEHRLIVLVALGFVLLGAIAPFPSIHKMSIEAWFLLVFLPSTTAVFVSGVAVTNWAWAGASETSIVFFAGPACVLAWLTGMQIRNGALRSRSSAIVLTPLLVAMGFFWTRDAPPALGAAAATQVFDSHLRTIGARNPHYVCRRYASTDDLADETGEDVSGIQFECESPSTTCSPYACTVWLVSFDDRGRIRNAVSPGAG